MRTQTTLGLFCSTMMVHLWEADPDELHAMALEAVRSSRR